ncbi:Protein G12 [Melipona quadrifasciata]|uniref:Protein G12 n=1 Tax=Melipona quadrifasciata TaxID=166423 RepID=A0A0M9A7T2_9HYME|nr:Protein G12 [Melipona quadrifasciata]
MKFVAILAVVAFASPLNAYTVPRTGSGALADQLQDFVNMVPYDDMVALLDEYVQHDPEMQQLVNYLQTNEFRNLVSGLEHIPQFVELLNYLQKAGLDAYFLVNQLNDYLHLGRISPSFRVTRATGGIRGFLDQIEAMLPLTQLEALYREKLNSSPVFSQFIRFLGSPTVQTVVDTMCANTVLNNFLLKLKGYGVRLEDGRDFLQNELGLHVSCVV